MTLTRLIPTAILAAGVAAAQPAPPAPPAHPAPAPAPVVAPVPPSPAAPLDAFDDVYDRLGRSRIALEEARDAARRLAPVAAPFDYDDVADRLGRQRVELEAAREAMAAARDRLDAGRFPFLAQIAPPAPPASPVAPARVRYMSDDRAYESGQRALESRRYTEALEYFNQVAARGKDRADGALYWKAYTLLKLGKSDEARAALSDLRSKYASSRWLDDAKALEVEAGKPVSPEKEADEDLKIIALNGLMQSDPDRAIPLLDGLLKGAQPPRIKRNALFVLSQSTTPKAQQMLEQVARGQGNPDLQLQAVRYLGERRRQGGSNPVLAEVYAATSDANVKRAILNAYESARDKDRLLQAAKTERDNDLRLHAIRLLASIKEAQPDLWSLYGSESNVEIKQHILEAMPGAGNLDRMLEIAKTERDPKLRRFAIQNLSTTRAVTTGDSLAGIYAGEQDQSVKRAIIDALGAQKNVKAMVQVARSEKDSRLQQQIIGRLVSMKSPEANDYLMEVIRK